MIVYLAKAPCVKGFGGEAASLPLTREVAGRKARRRERQIKILSPSQKSKISDSPLIKGGPWRKTAAFLKKHPNAALFARDRYRAAALSRTFQREQNLSGSGNPPPKNFPAGKSVPFCLGYSKAAGGFQRGARSARSAPFGRFLLVLFLSEYKKRTSTLWKVTAHRACKRSFTKPFMQKGQANACPFLLLGLSYLMLPPKSTLALVPEGSAAEMSLETLMVPSNMPLTMAL